MKVITKVPNNLRLAVFGSTYAMYALNTFTDLRLNAFNFAMDAQSIEIDNLLLHKYASHISDGATVIFGFAACVTFYRYRMTTDKSKYYRIFKPKELPDYSFLNNIKRVISLTNIKNRLKVALLGNPNTDYCIAPEEGCASREKRDYYLKSLVNGWIDLFGLQDLKEKDVSAKNQANMDFNTELLVSMVEFCLQHNWKPVLVITPFSHLLNEYFGKDFLDNSIRSMLGKVAAMYNIPYLDYQNTPEFQLDYSAYSDGGFRMSRYGSRKFTKLLLGDLNKLGHKLNNGFLRQK